MRIRGIAPGGPGRREDRGLERQRPLSCISAGLDVAPLPWRYLDSRSPLLPLCIILTLTRLASTLTRLPLKPSTPESVAESTSTAVSGDYYDEYWKDLPPDVQAAYAVLGFDENKWDNGLPSDTSTLGWEELGPARQAAALSLGYTEEVWCNTPAPTAAPPGDAAAGAAPDNATVSAPARALLVPRVARGRVDNDASHDPPSGRPPLCGSSHVEEARRGGISGMADFDARRGNAAWTAHPSSLSLHRPPTKEKDCSPSPSPLPELGEGV